MMRMIAVVLLRGRERKGGLERRSRNGAEWWEKMVGEPTELKCACE